MLSDQDSTREIFSCPLDMHRLVLQIFSTLHTAKDT